MKIKAKLLGGFLICTIIAVAVGLIGFFALNQTNLMVSRIFDENIQLKDYARVIGVLMLEARRDEKDFMLRGEEKYIRGVEENIEELKSTARKMKELEHDEAILAEIDEIISLGDEYKQRFLLTAEYILAKGMGDDGIIGEFRESAHKLEAVIDELGLIQLDNDLLEIRRREKDYLLRGDDKYVSGVSENILILKAHLNGIDIGPAEAAGIYGSLDEYESLFMQVAGLTER